MGDSDAPRSSVNAPSWRGGIRPKNGQKGLADLLAILQARNVHRLACRKDRSDAYLGSGQLMATITLRGYLQEIDRLIDNEQQFDEAIAHCRYILKKYPKHIGAYRLLGKAYLETKEYGDAADIFQRVLSAMPDDFVAHVGMAIVREDEGNLDAAIWHMERASEARPGNAAIEQELRRLIGKRDGLEPQRIRPTRGALARMYFHGELYDYAIAELRAALEEDPNRPDLQVLLATTYYRANHKPEAAEVCSALLEKLPFCFDANRISAALMLERGQREEAEVFLRRVASLEPYAAHLEHPLDDPQKVDSNLITITRLEWVPGQAMPTVGEQPDWAVTLGVDLEGGEEAPKAEMPSWLKGPGQGEEPAQGAEELPTVHPFAGAKPPPGAEIPEWMREAGWAESLGEAEPEEPELLEEAPDEEVPLERATLPPWLEEIAPADLAKTPAQQEPVPPLAGQEEATPAQMDEAPQAAPEEPAPIEPQMEDLAAPTPAEGEEPVEQAEEGLIEELEAISDVDIPGWLDAEAPGASDTIVGWLGTEPSQEREEVPSEGVPEWMRGTGPLDQAPPPSQMSDSAPQAAQEPTPSPESSEPAMEPAADAEISPTGPQEADESFPDYHEPPDWLKKLSLGEEEVEEQLATGEEGAPEWLASQETEESEIPAEPPSEPAPDWLEAGEKTPPEPLMQEQEGEPPPDWLKEVLTDEPPFTEEGGEEAKPAWVESLAESAAHLTPSAQEEPSAEQPGWVSELEQQSEPSMEGDQAEEEPEWLASLAAGEPEAAQEDATLLAEKPPPAPAEEAPQPQEEAPDWLQSLAEQAKVEGATQEPEVQPLPEPGLQQPVEAGPELQAPGPEQAEQPPPQPEEEAPDWIQDITKTQPAFEVEPPSEEERAPDWLKEIAPEGAALQAEEAPQGETPDWLQRIMSTEEEPFEEALQHETARLSALAEEERPQALEEAEAEPEAEAAGEQAAAEPVEAEATEEALGDETLTWLQETAIDVPEEGEALPELEPEQPEPPAAEVEPAEDETLTWLRKSVAEGEPEVAAELQAPLDEEEALEYLEELAAEQEPEAMAQEETAAAEVAMEAEVESESLIEEKELPEAAEEGIAWLEQLAGEEEEPSAAGEVAGEAPEEEVPEWLRAVAVESETEEAPSAAAEAVEAERIGEPEMTVPQEPEAAAEPPTGETPPWATETMVVSRDELRALEEKKAHDEKAEPAAVEAAPVGEPGPGQVDTPTEDETLSWLREVPEEQEAPTEPPAMAEEPPPAEAPSEQSAAEEAVQAPEARPPEASEAAEMAPPSPPPLAEEPMDRPFPPPPEEPAYIGDPLGTARARLDEGDLDGALDAYQDLIRKKVQLDEIIADLRQAAERYPRAPTLWQLLGDAYVESNKLAEAIDAYRRGVEVA